MKWRFWAVVASVLAVQVAFMPALRPLGVVPNLVLVLVVLVGLNGTASLALTVALIGGLLLDLTSGVDFGLRLGLLTLVALVTGFVHRAGLQAAGPMVALVLVAGATLLADFTVLAGLVRAGVDHWPWGSLIGTALLEVVLNLGGTLLLRPVVQWVSVGEAELPGLE